MGVLDELMGMVPVGQIAQRLGVDEATAGAAVQQALPTLAGGLEHNVATGGNGGQEGLLSALSAHEGGLLDGGVSLDDVDEADGEKIVAKALDGRQDAVAAQVASTGGVAPDLLRKVLPMLAPIVMAYLAKHVLGGSGDGSGGGVVAGSTTAVTTDARANAGGGGLGDVLGGLLGGLTGSGSGAGGGLGGILGGLLGGGR